MAEAARRVIMVRRLRVAVAAADPERAEMLGNIAARLGHEVVEAAEADVILADGEPAAIEAALEAVAARVVPPKDLESKENFSGMDDEEPEILLTPRELEVLVALSEGLSNKAVARRFEISQHTVKFHVESVFRKLGVTSRAEAVAKGLRRGLVNL